MNLDPRVRSSLASAVTDALEQAVVGSTAGLRGSLARGGADRYSDIDAFWEVPDSQFFDAIDESHAEATVESTDNKPVSEFLGSKLLDKLRKFCVDHAADSEEPMTCG